MKRSFTIKVIMPSFRLLCLHNISTQIATERAAAIKKITDDPTLNHNILGLCLKELTDYL